jgi:hypothetical protein
VGSWGPGVSVRPPVQGDRKAYPRRWPLAAGSCQDGGGRRDRGDLVAACIVAQDNSVFQTLMSMHPTTVLKPTVPRARAAIAPNETEPALKVATVYQDSLTRHWTTELWGQVGQLVGGGCISHQTWKISDLTDARVFTDAVQAAAEADVVVVSARDAGELPMNLYVWIHAWMPRRAGREGALVALLGVPAQPDAESGRVHACLETVARWTGLDFLPRERKLPEEPSACSALAGITPAASLTMSRSGGAPGQVAGVRLQRRLTE